MKRGMDAQGQTVAERSADATDPYADDFHQPCLAITQSSKKAADEADVLATEPRAMRPHGMVR